VLKIKFDCRLFMVSAIRAQLPTPWQYNLNALFPIWVEIRFEPLLQLIKVKPQLFCAKNKFDCRLFMVSAIRAQLPTPWQYNIKSGKNQGISDRISGIYLESLQRNVVILSSFLSLFVLNACSPPLCRA